MWSHAGVIYHNSERDSESFHQLCNAPHILFSCSAAKTRIYTLKEKQFWMKGYWTRSLLDKGILNESHRAGLLDIHTEQHSHKSPLRWSNKYKVFKDLGFLEGLVSVHKKLWGCKEAPSERALTFLKTKHILEIILSEFLVVNLHIVKDSRGLCSIFRYQLVHCCLHKLNRLHTVVQGFNCDKYLPECEGYERTLL